MLEFKDNVAGRSWDRRHKDSDNPNANIRPLTLKPDPYPKPNHRLIQPYLP